MKIIETIRELFHVQRVTWGKSTPPPAPPMPTLNEPLDIFGQLLGERLRLATEIADESARCEIECNCASERLGTSGLDWYDTSRNDAGGDSIYAEGIERALRYLDLRGRVVRHPTQRHLVRFER